MKTRILILGASCLALHLTALADYIAHEWGTFTSVQGADGVQLEWNPLLVSELPKFVYDRSRPRKAGAPVLAAKTALVARQRLETPVIYFYSKEERRVDVSVKFPEGTVTEWYPQQNPLPRPVVRSGEPAARWEQVRILAPAPSEPKYLQEATGSHYYAARATAANAVQMNPTGASAETEKFLFYRGVGQFTAPLKVTLEGPLAKDLRLTNTGEEDLTDLFVCEVRSLANAGGTGTVLTFAAVEALAAGATLAAPPPANETAIDQSGELIARLHSALERAGLFPAEAAAMVKTWEESWLGEPGRRVLYVLPRAWADRVLPLTLDPAPREVARVMVGRAEILSPEAENALQVSIEQFRTGDAATRVAAIDAARALRLGRFAEPAVRRACLAQPQNRAFSNAAWELLSAAYTPKTTAPTTAAR